MIREIIESEIRDGVIRGAAIYAGTLDEVCFAESFGFADEACTVPMGLGTIIDIASVTKVTATITALLVCRSRGLIDFDAPFTDYLPEYSAKLREPISVRELANHVSGFIEPSDRPRYYWDESGTVMLQKLMQLPPQHEKTAAPVYACWNYLLLAKVLENVAGKSIIDFCKTEIFEPLGMSDSSLGAPVTCDTSRLAQTIGTAQPGQISDLVAYRIYRDGGTTGNAGMFSTAEDLGKLLRCYLRHGKNESGAEVFSEEAFNEILSVTMCKIEGLRNFGWEIYSDFLKDIANGKNLSHSGFSGQTIYFDVEKKHFVVVLTTRIGDYSRAKQERYQIIRILAEQMKRGE